MATNFVKILSRQGWVSVPGLARTPLVQYFVQYLVQYLVQFPHLLQWGRIWLRQGPLAPCWDGFVPQQAPWALRHLLGGIVPYSFHFGPLGPQGCVAPLSWG